MDKQDKVGLSILILLILIGTTIYVVFYAQYPQNKHTTPSNYGGLTYVELPVSLSYQLIANSSEGSDYNYTATVYFPINTYGQVTVCTHCIEGGTWASSAGQGSFIPEYGWIEMNPANTNITYSLGFPSLYYNTTGNTENYISLSFQISVITQLPNECIYNNGNDVFLFFPYPIQCTAYGSVWSTSTSPLPTPPFV